MTPVPPSHVTVTLPLTPPGAPPSTEARARIALEPIDDLINA